MDGEVMRGARMFGLMLLPLVLVWAANDGGRENRSAVSGTVSFSGDVPAGVPVDMSTDAYCEQAQTEPLLATPVVVQGGRVADVIVYVREGVQGEHAAPDAEVTLGQSHCRYTPSVVVLQTGQTLRIHNDDDTFHNVHVFAQNNRPFNIGQPMKGMQARRQFGDPEIGIDVKCDVHGWMQGYVHVLDHPYYDVTAADGAFDLGDLSPGSYVIEAWHPALGVVSQSVQVADGQPVSLDLRF